MLQINNCEYISKEQFLFKRGNPNRWGYMNTAIQYAKMCCPSSVLEIGCLRLPLVKDSTVMDLPEFNGRKLSPGVIHDAMLFPYPFEDKVFDVVLALQVFEHLEDKQKQAFQELCRISKNIILSFPYMWVGKNEHSNIDEKVIKGWAKIAPEQAEVNVSPSGCRRIICLWKLL